MAGNGSTSGNGKTSAFGPPSGGKAGSGVDFVAKADGTSGGAGGNNFFTDPSGGGDKSGGNNFAEKPGGSDMVPEQKNGSTRNPTSIPAGGLTPFVKGGAEPAPSRTPPKSGFAAGSNPGSGPDRKPYKVK